ncbi:uncharacterized protein LOC135161664 [Diachasmimorpha longicaudata]|uniref:uncharacterized protein LOC135161664 n=1 Tax=Diachasmimorpha longicaudata TaxID=58733 RepID=UPI0030B8ACEF
MIGIQSALFIIGMTIGMVYGEGNQKVIVQSIKINDIADNPYFSQWAADIHSSGEKISFKTPFKQELPANMKVKLEISLDGDDLPEAEMDLCDIFDDDTLGKDLIEHGLPDGQFPTECPIQGGDNFEVQDYPLPKDEKIPQGTKDGPFHSVVSIYEEGKDPIIIIEADGEVMHY